MLIFLTPQLYLGHVSGRRNPMSRLGLLSLLPGRVGRIASPVVKIRGNKFNEEFSIETHCILLLPVRIRQVGPAFRQILKLSTSLAFYGMSVITLVTVQNTQCVSVVEPPSR